MLNTPRTIRVALVASACLLAAHTARAESITFQSIAGHSIAQSGTQSGAQSGGGKTSTSKVAQGGGSQTGQVQTGEVQNVDLGDVTGTVCDCGEIAPDGAPGASTSGGGGFPRLPLLAFAAAPGIPCIFTDLCSRNPPRRPPPELPPPAVPEPLTLVTFATGLGASAALRRRRRK